MHDHSGQNEKFLELGIFQCARVTAAKKIEAAVSGSLIFHW
jgi:hypothetical protein